MTTFEDQLRADLRDLSDRVLPVSLLDRLDREAPRSIRRRRLAVAAVAAAAAIVVTAAGSVVLDRVDRPRTIEPSLTPPKVFRLSGVTSTAPGRATIAVLFPVVADDEPTPVYVLPAAGGDAVLVPPSDRVPRAWLQVLSVDGTRLVRQVDDFTDPKMEIVNLVSGRSNHLAGTLGYCPLLSPDNATASVNGAEGEGILLVDVSTGDETPLPGTSDSPEDCGPDSTSWSPDGTLLTYRLGDGLALADRNGVVALRVPGKSLTNSSMSWSPDGRSVLVYDRGAGEFSVVDTDTGEAMVLARPNDAVKPLGWAGARVVWLVGAAGNQRLVSTDRQGGDERTWMRLDVGDLPVETVQWTRDLAGTAG